MRDHTRLRAFELAENLALDVYRVTRSLPPDERFGLTSQMRRAAISIGCNIVEGCARQSKADYLRFLDIALGSSRELEYQVSIAHRLGFVCDGDYARLYASCVETSKVLGSLARALRRQP